MKPSNLKKDGNFSGRINREILKKLKAKGVSAQSIVDAYVDNLFKVETKLKWKSEK